MKQMVDLFTACFMFFWFLAWTRNGWHNILAKMSFAGLAIWYGLEALEYYGYIIKTIPE